MPREWIEIDEKKDHVIWCRKQFLKIDLAGINRIEKKDRLFLGHWERKPIFLRDEEFVMMYFGTN